MSEKDDELDGLIDKLTSSAKDKGKEAIRNNFAPYIKFKAGNDYLLNINGQNVPTGVLLLSDGQENFIDQENQRYTKEAIAAFNPDNIDNAYFWKVATDNFPLFSVCGNGTDQHGNILINSVDDVNGRMFQMHHQLGAIDEVDQLFNENPEAKILDIGPGHGMLAGYIGQKFGVDSNYLGIDINPLINHPRILKCDGSTFPNEVPHDLDMVYSINVFQHLSKAQRSSYYNEVWDHLDVGGVFVFGMFVRTPENAGWEPHWSTKDTDGNIYCHFFKQYTRIDDIGPLVKELEGIGFRVKNTSRDMDKSHYLTFRCTKPYDAI